MFSKAKVLLLILFISCCSSTTKENEGSSEPSFDYGTLFLRGSFSWWEADENFKVNEVSKGVYRVIVELVADGQPYDFKFADKGWTNGLSCGFLDKEDDEIISLGKKVSVNCYTLVDNFIFIPEESGKYIFSIDFSGWGDPRLTVDKL